MATTALLGPWAQLIVGEEYLRLPGNNERYFPLLLGGFILAGGTAVAAWRALDPDALPTVSTRLGRTYAVVLTVVAAYLVVGALYRPLLAHPIAIVHSGG